MESQPLLVSNNSFWLEFLVFSACFGVNHGTITVTLSLASSLIDPGLSGVGNSLLYIVYGITALLAAFGVVRLLGTMRTLALMMSAYFMYVLSYLIAVAAPSVARPSVYLGGVLGGIAAGTLWTAQGVYFSRMTLLYLNRPGTTSMPKKEATGKLAGIFAIIFLSAELTLKLISSVWLGFNGPKGSTVSPPRLAPTKATVRPARSFYAEIVFSPSVLHPHSNVSFRTSFQQSNPYTLAHSVRPSSCH